MNKLKSLRISGFRRLGDVQLDLQRRSMMVMIGANGVGKTSVLDAVSLLSASATKLSSGLSAVGGVASVLTRGIATDLEFAASMEVPGHEPLDYEICIRPKSIGYEIYRESLSQRNPGRQEPFKHIIADDKSVKYYDGNRLVAPSWEYDTYESALSQVVKLYKQPEEFRKMLSTATLYHVLDIGRSAPVKQPQPMKPASLPGANGEDLVPMLYTLQQSDKYRFEAIVDALHAAFPSFDEIAFPPVAAGTMAMTWTEKSFPKPLYMNELSEGTLRFLWLVALLQSPSLSTITMIDEPEVSLHPELLSLLVDLMREASSRTQLIVATHSDRLVRFLEPNEVLVLDSGEDGLTTATWADELDLEKWLADYSLDEVWQMGVLGDMA